MHCLHMLLPSNKNCTITSETVNPMFYLSVPPMFVNVLLLTGAVWFVALFFLQLALFYHWSVLCLLLCTFFMHVCCVNSIKCQYEYLTLDPTNPTRPDRWVDPTRVRLCIRLRHVPTSAFFFLQLLLSASPAAAGGGGVLMYNGLPIADAEPTLTPDWRVNQLSGLGDQPLAYQSAWQIGRHVTARSAACRRVCTRSS